MLRVRHYFTQSCGSIVPILCEDRRQLLANERIDYRFKGSFFPLLLICSLPWGRIFLQLMTILACANSGSKRHRVRDQDLPSLAVTVQSCYRLFPTTRDWHSFLAVLRRQSFWKTRFCRPFSRILERQIGRNNRQIDWTSCREMMTVCHFTRKVGEISVYSVRSLSSTPQSP